MSRDFYGFHPIERPNKFRQYVRDTKIYGDKIKPYSVVSIRS